MHKQNHLIVKRKKKKIEQPFISVSSMDLFWLHKTKLYCKIPALGAHVWG